MTDEPSAINNDTVSDISDFSVSQYGNQFITLWSLRVLLRLNFKERFFELHGILSSYDVLQSAGLLEYFDNDAYHKPENRKETMAKMEKQLAELEKKAPFDDDVMIKGVRLLQASLSLTETDVDLLHLAAAMNQNSGLGVLFDMIGELNQRQAKQILSIVLARPTSALDHSLSANGALFSSGLFDEEHTLSRLASLRGYLMLPENILSALSRPHKTQASLLESFFRASPEPRLSIADYSHIDQDFSLIKRYVQAAIKNHTEGVNILIYGAPGTGKTEMVRAICAEAQLQLHEIAMEGQGGQPIYGPERFVTLKLSQRLLKKSTSDVLLFDEVEDVFPLPQQYYYEQSRSGDIKKSWINNILETNHVPTFWLCNHVHQIDPSYLRRFDIALQLRPLNSDVRLRTIKKYMKDIPVSESWLRHMAEQEALVPAVIERAVKVVNHLKPEQPKEVETLLEKVIGNTLEVMGLPRSSRKKVPQNTEYNLDYLNPDVDLAKLCNRFHENSSARICLYGPPGTGKTAFAHHLARVLGKGILVKRASDILSKWVGEAEKNIASMFEEATQNHQILLLDEADSFLQERQSAGQAWEVTQVNEMLTQMEVFNGIFIASTNLKDSLDAASLRRFEFKVKFDYLRGDQAWQLFRQVCEEQGAYTGQMIELHRHQLAKLDRLTAGDFATVIRQSACFAEALTPALLIDGLLKEIQAKPDYSKTIGFL